MPIEINRQKDKNMILCICQGNLNRIKKEHLIRKVECCQ